MSAGVAGVQAGTAAGEGERAASPSAVGEAFGAALVAALAVGVFIPVLGNDFVNWDDHRNFLFNPHYRGLGAEQLDWISRTTLTGHWIPVTWLTLAVDYTIWGLDPFGYHLTNLVLHAANAALLFLLAVRLLRLTAAGTAPETIRVGALVAALAFALHPLRVESVAWVTERRDVLSGLFALLAVLAYVRAYEPGAGHRDRWRLAALVAFHLAMLSKSIVVSLPLVLLVLDVYPLRRIRWGRWSDVPTVLRDKLPYVPIAALGAFVAIRAGRANEIFAPLDSVSVLDRIALVAHSLAFYLSRTVVPAGLSPLHELPSAIGLLRPPFLASLLAIGLLTATALRWRARWPALPAVLLVYALVLAPVSGALQNGYQLVAERYSYLACMPWALLLGGALCALARGRGPGATWRYRLALCGVGAWLMILAHTTVAQAAVWRNSETLWRATVVADPGCALCHHFYAIHLKSRHEYERALAHLARAVALRPSRQGIVDYLVQATLCRHRMGDREAAYEDLEALRRMSPRMADLAGRAMVTDW